MNVPPEEPHRIRSLIFAGFDNPWPCEPLRNCLGIGDAYQERARDPPLPGRRGHIMYVLTVLLVSDTAREELVIAPLVVLLLAGGAERLRSGSDVDPEEIRAGLQDASQVRRIGRRIAAGVITLVGALVAVALGLKIAGLVALSALAYLVFLAYGRWLLPPRRRPR